ncbi:uncharacterized protein LOC115626148 [Scaptodrosophila lebanonensis]|uniref:Uncharacterized protein LOC115626148 n=1 Tax=Drosophila lebanonensis TaxID=7225 RepID=A0A6J2TQP5_DROLE|nr:uncharacterized protein LOC115626148 [Scaptodrosophila lebanonensis]
MTSSSGKRSASYWRERSATLPAFVSPTPEVALQHRASILWAPKEELPDDGLQDYLQFAYTNYSIEEEQALYILRQQSYDLTLARDRLASIETARGCRFCRWRAKDLLHICKALKKHGVDYEKVGKGLPHIPIADMRSFVKFMKVPIDLI